MARIEMGDIVAFCILDEEDRPNDFGFGKITSISRERRRGKTRFKYEVTRTSGCRKITAEATNIVVVAKSENDLHVKQLMDMFLGLIQETVVLRHQRKCTGAPGYVRFLEEAFSKAAI